MTTTTIPATRDILVTDLTAAGDLLRATGWQLAATVWAWTEDTGRGGAPRTNANFFTLSGFAELGIRGLRSRPSVTRYRRAWQEAIDAGHACSVNPGDSVDLPDSTLWSFDADGRLVDLTAGDPEPDERFTPRPRVTPVDDPEPDDDDEPDDTPEWRGVPLDDGERERRQRIYLIDRMRAELQTLRDDAQSETLRDSTKSQLLAIRNEIDVILEGFR